MSLVAAAFACTPKDTQSISVVPYPNEVQLKSGRFDISGAEIGYDAATDERSKALFNRFAQQLSLATGVECNVTEGCQGSDIRFILDVKLPHEAYSLSITKKGITVKASTTQSRPSNRCFLQQYMEVLLPLKRTGVFHV